MSSLPASPEACAQLVAGLSRPLPEVPPRYFYDDLGSALFEEITALPEYYQTRTELGILEASAAEILATVAPLHLAELGSGAGRKIRLLLERMDRGTCTMLDVNQRFLDDSIRTLGLDYPQIRFRGVAGDMNHDLHLLGPGGSRLLLFFAGTIGNLHPEERHQLLDHLAQGMAPDDGLLIGVDLVKAPQRLERAYNDSQGVTAAFNRNALSVLNRTFEADFRPESFEHVAFYDPENAWIEMRLRARSPQDVQLKALSFRLSLPAGAELRTEISCKFTRSSLEKVAAAAGLQLQSWYTDAEELFAMAMFRKVQP